MNQPAPTSAPTDQDRATAHKLIADNFDRDDMGRLREAFAAALQAERERTRAEGDVCWHCGTVLVPAKPRCEDCPDECDLEDCDAMGCALETAQLPQGKDK